MAVEYKAIEEFDTITDLEGVEIGIVIKDGVAYRMPLQSIQDAKDGAETAQGLAETAQGLAETAQGLAETARDKAQDWAEEVEDTPVETGKYSALHWAAKANDAKDAAVSAQGLAETAQGLAETAQGLAETARDKAADWAEKAEDTTVETGKYSALHHAAKAAKNVVSVLSETDGSFSIDTSHVGKYVRVGYATGVTVTVPLNATAALEVGTVITLIQTGDGAITLAGETAGVTLNAFESGLITAGNYAAIQLIKVATDEWDVIGGVSA